MIPMLSVLLLTWIPRGPAPAPDIRPVMARFEKECQGRGGPACDELQAQLERALYQELLVIELGGKDPERRVLRVAARGQLPELAAFALRRLGRWASAEDAPLAAAGLESPYPAVRSAAADLARSVNDPQLRRLAGRGGISDEGSKSGLVPSRSPDAQRLGTGLYPGSSYSFAASHPDLAVFRTPDSPDKVVAHFARGKRVLSGAELNALKKTKGGKKNDEEMASEMMQAMMSGKDPQVVIRQMQESAQAMNMSWTTGIEGVDGIVAPRYVILEESGPQKLPTKVVAVYRDEALGTTAVAYRLTPSVPSYATAAQGGRLDPAYFQALQQLQMRQD